MDKLTQFLEHYTDGDYYSHEVSNIEYTIGESNLQDNCTYFFQYVNSTYGYVVITDYETERKFRKLFLQKHDSVEEAHRYADHHYVPVEDRTEEPRPEPAAVKPVTRRPAKPTGGKKPVHPATRRPAPAKPTDAGRLPGKPVDKRPVKPVDVKRPGHIRPVKAHTARPKLIVTATVASKLAPIIKKNNLNIDLHPVQNQEDDYVDLNDNQDDLDELH